MTDRAEPTRPEPLAPAAGAAGWRLRAGLTATGLPGRTAAAAVPVALLVLMAWSVLLAPAARVWSTGALDLYHPVAALGWGLVLLAVLAGRRRAALVLAGVELLGAVAGCGYLVLATGGPGGYSRTADLLAFGLLLVVGPALLGGLLLAAVPPECRGRTVRREVFGRGGLALLPGVLLLGVLPLLAPVLLLGAFHLRDRVVPLAAGALLALGFGLAVRQAGVRRAARGDLVAR
ncbi:hypothetical protein [Kitasatospora sp. NPDC002040]|uniref:hypothetical protein n=1 Tax=Kitasatospora sp. NPDC002040 TaxID=3154661 RepID=UPI00332C9573